MLHLDEHMLFFICLAQVEYDFFRIYPEIGVALLGTNDPVRIPIIVNGIPLDEDRSGSFAHAGDAVGTLVIIINFGVSIPVVEIILFVGFDMPFLCREAILTILLVLTQAAIHLSLHFLRCYWSQQTTEGMIILLGQYFYNVYKKKTSFRRSIILQSRVVIQAYCTLS